MLYYFDTYAYILVY